MRVGIIGAGHFGAVHARAIAAVEGIEAVACCSSDLAGAQAFAGPFGLAAHPDWRALLDDARVDTVVIATPHHLHEDIAIAAAQAGKHTLLEKPLAPTLAACDAVIGAAQRAGVTLMAGHVVRYFAPFMAARAVIEAGDLGRPLVGYSQMIKLWMEGNRKPWHLKADSGGGMLMTGGIHAIDLLVWLMGDEVASVSAQIGTFFNDQPVDDTAMIALRFAGGGLGQVQSIGYRDGAMSYGTEIICENGVLRADLKNGVQVGQGGAWRDIATPPVADLMHDAVVREWQAMRDAVQTGTPAPIGGDYARHIVAIIEAAMRSNTERRESAVQARLGQG